VPRPKVRVQCNLLRASLASQRYTGSDPRLTFSSSSGKRSLPPGSGSPARRSHTCRILTCLTAVFTYVRTERAGLCHWPAAIMIYGIRDRLLIFPAPNTPLCIVQNIFGHLLVSIFGHTYMHVYIQFYHTTAAYHDKHAYKCDKIVYKHVYKCDIQVVQFLLFGCFSHLFFIGSPPRSHLRSYGLMCFNTLSSTLPTNRRNSQKK
jgi:hypothetical protein